jgi:hypothetical protein
VLLPRVVDNAFTPSPKSPATKQLQLVEHIVIIFPEFQQICRRLLMCFLKISVQLLLLTPRLLLLLKQSALSLDPCQQAVALIKVIGIGGKVSHCESMGAVVAVWKTSDEAII